MGIAKRLYGRRHYGGDYRLSNGKPVDRSLGARPKCSWCLRGEEAGPLPEDLDGKRTHDECRAELARLRGEGPPADPAPRHESPPDPASAPGLWWPALGPLPLPSVGREHRIHNGCGGRGCGVCRHTGYATMGRLAIARLLVCTGERPGIDPTPPTTVPTPATLTSIPTPTRPAEQLAFTFGD